mmetsp:Transcript_5376/g.8463  ORF Transcript_5376/g.8463 Transcript_5376/m.8463 type:complete len:866 (-) Transcript_5376:14-2611(-)
MTPQPPAVVLATNTTTKRNDDDDDCDETASASSPITTPHSITMFPVQELKVNNKQQQRHDDNNTTDDDEEEEDCISPFHSFDSEEERRQTTTTTTNTLNNHQQQLKKKIVKERELPPRQEVKTQQRQQDASKSSLKSSSSSSARTFQPQFQSTKLLQYISKIILPSQYTKTITNNNTSNNNNNTTTTTGGTLTPNYHSTWIGFWSLLIITCANYVLSPLRDAVALAVGVDRLPQLTLAGTVLAFVSSVPIGWLFEAPDPARRKIWRNMGLTRGETQGTSLALFYRAFALCLCMYAMGFWIIVQYKNNINTTKEDENDDERTTTSTNDNNDNSSTSKYLLWFVSFQYLFQTVGQMIYICFFLVVHLMKLHSLSLIWGVATEAMEYEDNDNLYNASRQQQQASLNHHPKASTTNTTTTSAFVPRLRRLAFMGFGGTLGGILGSFLASSMAHCLQVSGLLLLAAVLLEIGAELSIELGRVMLLHWEKQQLRSSPSYTNFGSDAATLQRVSSFGSMKRVASGNSLHKSNSNKELQNLHHANANTNASSATSLSSFNNNSNNNSNNSNHHHHQDNTDTTDGNNNNNNNNHTATSTNNHPTAAAAASNTSTTTTTTETTPTSTIIDDNTFTQRLLRGITTILRSRLLLSIFTYNALYASTTVLLSFQRAALVAAREHSTVESDTRFLANINMVSSLAVLVLQATGAGAALAHHVGSRGTLSLMPLIRFVGVVILCWWHCKSGGRPPPLVAFIGLDECTRVMNLAVAKPVRESLWRGLSNEARYEAKPIVDTLANRWGGGSAAFLVSVGSKCLLWMGFVTNNNKQEASSGAELFGLPPILCLCLLISAWWAMVSADLGHVRHKIDLELKKRE